MPHLVLSRKYRPQRFEDLVGQDAVSQTLSNAISSGRIGHAYLFVGPRGTGKTTTARIFAKALNCERGPTPTPCGECASCRDVTAGSDLDVVELDAASHNGVDDVRALRDSVGYHPARSRFRVWIVDEVHMLSVPAFNAFLKTLEEPPPQAKFIFCTTEAHRLPETFTSRCQRIEFRRIDERKMADRLRSLLAREGMEAEEGVLDRIAAGALGGLRDAESLLEQLLASAAGGRLSLSDLDSVLGRAPEERVNALFDAIAAGDARLALASAETCLSTGCKPDVLLDQVLETFRRMLPDAAGAAGTPSERSSGSATRGAAFGLARVARSLDVLLEKRRHLKEGADGRLVVEVAAVELARLPSAHDLDAVIRALRAGDAVGASSPGVHPASLPAVLPGEGRGRTGNAPRPSPGSDAGVPAAHASTGPTPHPAAPTRAASPFSGNASRVDPRPNAALASPGCAAGKPVAHGEGVAVLEGSGEGADVSAVGPSARAGEPAAPEPVSLALVLARWEEIVQGVEVRSRRLHACLARAKPIAVMQDVLLLALPETETVARAILRDREAGGALREATKEVLGTALRAAVADGFAAAGLGMSALRGVPIAGRPPAPSRAPVRPTPPGPPQAPIAPQRVVPSAAPAAPPAVPAPTPGGGVSRSGSRSESEGTGPRAEDVRANPQVRAVLEGFSARLLAVERTTPAASATPEAQEASAPQASTS